MDAIREEALGADSIGGPSGREGQKGRQPETASQLRRDAKLQGAGLHHRRVRSRKREGGWPGRKAVSQGGGGEHPRGKPYESNRGPLHGPDGLRAGIKALKGARGGRLERTLREPQESRDRATGTDPVGGQSSERASRHAAGRRLPAGRFGMRPGARSSVEDDGPSRSERGGSPGASGSVADERTSGEPLRMDAIREEALGADSMGGPTGPGNRRLGERLQEASGAAGTQPHMQLPHGGGAGSDSSESVALRTPRIPGAQSEE
jgi:hypothetical protein